jgi:Tol biopolymer transport system component
LLVSQISGPEPEIYEVPLPNGAPRKLPLPSNAGWPTISGHKLAYSNISNNINIWRKDVLHPQLPPVELLSSTRQQNQAEYSPDGKHIAFHSNRSGAWTLWMSDADGANVVQIANLEVSPGNPHWAPDSSHIVFASDHLGHTETYVVEVSERVPRRVVTRIREMSTPSWSHDGKWIYFRSREGLEYKLYRCSPDGGTATLIPADPEVTGPLESSDGSAIYFAPRLVKAQLKKTLLNGSYGGPEQVGVTVLSWTLWTVGPAGLYFVSAGAPESLYYFDFETKQRREVLQVQKDFDDGLSVSPDGRYILYSQVDAQNSDIMLVDDFR